MSPLLTWLNLVCLDAPLVAVSWALLFARAFDVSLAVPALGALFLTAWLIYLADRLGDSFAVTAGAPSSLRQRFCIQHRRAWLIGLGLIAVVDLLVVSVQLDARTTISGAVVGAVAFGYLMLNRFAPIAWRRTPLKEIAIGFIFAAGVLVPLAGSATTDMLLPWLMFGALCSLNCISIAVWERELDLAQERVSIATTHPEVGGYLPHLPLVLAAVAIALAGALGEMRALYGCIGASALLLALLHIQRAQLRVDVRTALADLVLLTPLVGIAFAP